VICPYCEVDNDKVIDSRASDGGRVIRRRRECLHCGKRFTTYERVEQTSRLMVVKRDGTHVPFDRQNVLKGIIAACGKRPIPEEVKLRIAEEIEEELVRDFEREVGSGVIGERVMRKLLEVDEVAFLRFASEYHQFQSVEDMRRQLDDLSTRPRDVKHQQNLF
jgi:transcriptional repressor NrdR